MSSNSKYSLKKSKKSSGDATKSDNEPVVANTSELKFSIQRILSEDCVCKKEEQGEEAGVSEDEGSLGEEVQQDRKEGDEQAEATSYDWLQCTRYKPPKLQRKFLNVI